MNQKRVGRLASEFGCLRWRQGGVTLLAVLVLLAGGVSLISCNERSSVQEAVEETKDEAKDAKEELQDELDDQT